ncbi:MAG: hypothetical protein GF308_05030 [Candidatus Heimdallarchaeota archaeon]|nr:hypothetical protein [Candidatus Heimdallarchaeota archaeon]
MKIEKTRFGSITIDGKKYSHDVYIFPNGQIEKRKKELSKPYSRGHTVLGPEEINLLLDQNPAVLVIGKGQYGSLPIPDRSRDILEDSGVIIIEDKLPVIIERLNKLLENKEKIAAILHVTC